MKTVLLVAYYYPPLGGIGSQRSQKFVRYLEEFGWRPVVLAPERGSYYLDPSLDDLTAQGVKVLRTRTLDLGAALKRAAGGGEPLPKEAAQNVKETAVLKALRRAVHTWVYIPDGQIGWYPFAVRAGKRAVSTLGVDALYSSSFPVTAHLIAYRLKLATGRPWIADFRDLWTEHHYASYSSRLRKRIDQVVESKVLNKADLILTVSDGFADTLRRLVGGRTRVEVIRNGFDSSDFANIERRNLSKWTITYVGNFYGARQDPSPLLEALSRAIATNRIPREDVCFEIVGEPDTFVQETLVRFGLTDVTSFTGVVTHRESLSHQVSSSLLVLILYREHANPGVIPGKLFEYLGSRRPILGIVPSDFETSRIIRETGAGLTIDPSNVKRIEDALVESYQAYCSGSDVEDHGTDLSAYERRAGARRLADLLTELTQSDALVETPLPEVARLA